jgi:hypothetical protein
MLRKIHFLRHRERVSFLSQNVRVPQFGNDLIHCVTFLRHFENPFRARRIKILSLTVVQFYGGSSMFCLRQVIRQLAGRSSSGFAPIRAFRDSDQRLPSVTNACPDALCLR